MSYVFTGVQHTKTNGDIIIESVEYSNKNEYKQRYHHEMDYAMSNDDFIGLGIKVYDKGTLAEVLNDNWVRAEGEDPAPVAQTENQSTEQQPEQQS